MAVYPAGSYVAANLEALAHADDAALQIGDNDATIVAWAYIVDLSDNYRRVTAKVAAVDGKREWMLGASPSAYKRYRFMVSPNGSNPFTSVEAATYGPVQLNTWVMLVAYHDSVNNKIGISVNGGAFDTADHSTGICVSDTIFTVGAVATGVFPSAGLMNGRIGPVGIAKGYVLTSDDISELYNSGSGRLWAQLSSDLKAKFGKAWWDMTEESDGSGAVARASWDGDLNLTDYNTVASADGPIEVPAAGGVGSIFDSGIFRPVLVR